MPPSCALLGGFAIGARVALLWQHNANAKCYRVRACTLSMPSFLSFFIFIFLSSFLTIAWSKEISEPNRPIFIKFSELVDM